MIPIASICERDLHIRLARLDDAHRLWEWANDPTVRANSLHPEPISWDSHLDWFQTRLGAPETRFWIIEVTGQAVGQIRYDRNEGRSAEVSVSVAQTDRGKGYGSQLIRLTRDRARTELEVEEIVAAVIEGNTASLQLFLRAGFEVRGLSKLNGRSCYWLTWRPARNASECKEDE